MLLVAEKSEAFVHTLFEVAEANDFAEAFLLVQYAVGTAERL